MSEFDHIVQKQRDMMKAEEWALKVKSLHAHSLTSMWYDTRNHDGSVMDTEYNDGVVEREIRKTGEIVYFGTRLHGDDLLNDYYRNGQ
tara:strand:+ start:1411 stop:1674 length:264 start_codon:yes stop_codon:yes gene_type:complete